MFWLHKIKKFLPFSINLLLFSSSHAIPCPWDFWSFSLRQYTSGILSAFFIRNHPNSILTNFPQWLQVLRKFTPVYFLQFFPYWSWKSRAYTLVETAIFKGPRFMVDGTIKLHKWGVSTTFTRQGASRDTCSLTTGESVAAITRKHSWDRHSCIVVQCVSRSFFASRPRFFRDFRTDNSYVSPCFQQGKYFPFSNLTTTNHHSLFLWKVNEKG